MSVQLYLSNSGTGAPKEAAVAPTSNPTYDGSGHFSKLKPAKKSSSVPYSQLSPPPIHVPSD